MWRRHVPSRRARLADDVRRLAGLADFAVDEARRLGAEVPEGVAEGVAACAVVWHHWAWRLGEWARGEGR